MPLFLLQQLFHKKNLNYHQKDIELRLDYLKSAILTGNINSVKLLMEYGLNIADISPESLVCAGLSSGSLSMMKFIVNYVDFSKVNFSNLTKSFRYNSLDVAYIVYSYCNDVKCLRVLFKAFAGNRIAQVFKNRLIELGVDPNVDEDEERQKAIAHFLENENCSDILSDSEIFS